MKPINTLRKHRFLEIVGTSGVLTHVRNYFSAGMLAAMAGIVSFPLLTRSLTVAEYGILGLITSSLTLFVAFGKLGVQHAVIRYYAQIKNKNTAFNMNEMSSTIVLLFLTLATVTTGLWIFTGYTLLPRISNFENISQLAVVASGIVFLRLLGSGILNYMRAQQRSAVVGTTLILSRYLYLFMIIGVMFLHELSVVVVLVSMLIAEIISVGFAARKYWPDFHFKPRDITATLGKAMLLYGMPLMILESLGLVMRLSDRYIIQAMLGENALGMYSASYNLTAYLDLIILAAMVQALKPYYMQLWETDGAVKTRAFLADGIHSYLVVGVPLITIFSLVSPHLLNFLASDKYAPGTIIIPFVAFSFLLEGAMHFLAAGLYIKKNTKTLMLWGGLATLLNLGLNLVAIPVFGILGAAVVTVISYFVFVLGVSFKSFTFLSFNISVRIPLLVTVLSLIVYVLLFKLNVGSDFINLVVKGLTSSLLLVIVVLLVDAKIRTMAFARLRPPEAGTVK